MWKSVCTTIDRLTIRAAAAALQAEERDCHLAEAEALMRSPEFIPASTSFPEDFQRLNQRRYFFDFQFTSAIRTPWEINNIVHGRVYPAGPDWRQRPTTVLLHGWNGEKGYDWQFPYLAWRLNRMGVNAAMLELPYHGRRRPRDEGAIRNFISQDLLRMVEATQQAVADIRSLMAWVRNEGSPGVGLWGVSLGAWFAGLVACHDQNVRFAVLLTPVVQMEQAIQELEFCAPIRQSLAGVTIRLEGFNLASHVPALPLENILIVQSRYDLFAPPQTVERLWETWGRPEIWRMPHGHITVLMSLPSLEKTVRWIAARTRAARVEYAAPQENCQPRSARIS